MQALELAGGEQAQDNESADQKQTASLNTGPEVEDSPDFEENSIGEIIAKVKSRKARMEEVKKAKEVLDEIQMLNEAIKGLEQRTKKKREEVQKLLASDAYKTEEEIQLMEKELSQLEVLAKEVNEEFKTEEEQTY